MTPTDAIPPVDTAADHARVWALLPWLVNGSASAEQQADAQAHLAHCVDCRAELQWQTELQAAFLQAPAAMPEVEAGLQKLLGRLDTDADAPPDPDLAQDALAGGLPGHWAAAPRVRTRPATPAGDSALARPTGGRTTRWLAAAVVVQAVALGALGVAGLAGGRAGDAAPYRALSQAPAAPAATTLRVLPDAQLPLGQWQLLLLQEGLQVVEGPNTAGAYGLAPMAGTASAPAGTAARQPMAADALARLRAHPGIRMAEPVRP